MHALNELQPLEQDLHEASLIGSATLSQEIDKVNLVLFIVDISHLSKLLLQLIQVSIECLRTL